MSEVGLGTLWGEPWGPGSAGWPGAVPFHARWALLAWVDTGSAPGRSYKCVEKSDLKYPLIHGQGRQVSERPLRESLLNRPCRGGSSFVPHGGPWLRS